MDKYEIAVLAEDYHNKSQRFRSMGIANTYRDPEKAREQSIQYHSGRSRDAGGVEAT